MEEKKAVQDLAKAPLKECPLNKRHLYKLYYGLLRSIWWPLKLHQSLRNISKIEHKHCNTSALAHQNVTINYKQAHKRRQQQPTTFHDTQKNLISSTMTRKFILDGNQRRK
jgi:hypothetical protein